MWRQVGEYGGIAISLSLTTTQALSGSAPSPAGFASYLSTRREMASSRRSTESMDRFDDLLSTFGTDKALPDDGPVMGKDEVFPQE